MAPSAKILERDLKKVVREMFDAEEELTVNAVRKRVEELHDLDEGFFMAPEWKDKSKTIIKDLAGKLDEGNASDADPEEQSDVPYSSPMARPKPKRAHGVKRSSPSEDPPAPKRQKRVAPAKPVKKRKPAKKVESESESSEEEDDDESSEQESELSEEEDPKPRRKGAKKAAKKDSESELSDLDSSEEEKPKRKASAKPKTKGKAAEADSKLSEPDKDEGDTADKNEEKAPEKPKADTTKQGDVIDSDSELSSVIDEPPPKKRGKGAAPKSAPKSSTAKAPKELSADEEEVKKLQGQLVKCGIRKIWGIELKQYGDDNKAKIRHLRGMLTNAGMTGRFSEARAKEIKEQRELMADLEAVTDMNALWGSAAGGGRASRSRATKKSLKEPSDDEDDDDDDNDKKAGDDDDDDDEEAKANSRVSKRMADLAFLGDESESD